MTPDISKFSPTFQCPKCHSDKCSTRLDLPAETEQDMLRRRRLKWPQGELMVQTCNICGHVALSRPLDYQEPTND